MIRRSVVVVGLFFSVLVKVCIIRVFVPSATLTVSFRVLLSCGGRMCSLGAGLRCSSAAVLVPYHVVRYCVKTVGNILLSFDRCPYVALSVYAGVYSSRRVKPSCICSSNLYDFEPLHRRLVNSWAAAVIAWISMICNRLVDTPACALHIEV